MHLRAYIRNYATLTALLEGHNIAGLDAEAVFGGDANLLSQVDAGKSEKADLLLTNHHHVGRKLVVVMWGVCRGRCR